MAEQLMTLAYENGINLFDTAEVYAAGKWVHVMAQISRKEGQIIYVIHFKGSGFRQCPYFDVCVE